MCIITFFFGATFFFICTASRGVQAIICLIKYHPKKHNYAITSTTCFGFGFCFYLV